MAPSAGAGPPRLAPVLDVLATEAHREALGTAALFFQFLVQRADWTSGAYEYRLPEVCRRFGVCAPTVWR
jgi:hypothetical protein